nr:exonuclease domain-containing protein [Bacilli bacterium]
ALLAYNASFDLQFLFAFFKKMKMEHILNLSHIDYYDCLTMYKDRAPYPHKLQDAINFYGLKEEVKNSHRALDDARATLVLFQTMMNQCDDGLNYRNLFGYNPKYPRRHHPIHKIKFRPQAYGASKKIYK